MTDRGQRKRIFLIIKGLFAEGPVTFSGAHYTIKNLDGAPKPQYISNKSNGTLKMSVFSSAIYARFTSYLKCIAPKPLQRPQLPLLVGGTGKRMLSLATRCASIVGLTPRTLPGTLKIDVTTTTPIAMRHRIEWIRQAAAERFFQLELHIVLLAVAVTEDRENAAQQIAENLGMTAEEVLVSPYCLVGTIDHMCEEVCKRREQNGISYVGIYEQSMERLPRSLPA